RSAVLPLSGRQPSLLAGPDPVPPDRATLGEGHGGLPGGEHLGRVGLEAFRREHFGEPFWSWNEPIALEGPAAPARARSARYRARGASRASLTHCQAGSPGP